MLLQPLRLIDDHHGTSALHGIDGACPTVLPTGQTTVQRDIFSDEQFLIGRTTYVDTASLTANWVCPLRTMRKAVQ